MKTVHVILSFLFGIAVITIGALLVLLFLELKTAKGSFENTIICLFPMVIAVAFGTGLGAASFTFIEINRISKWPKRVSLLIFLPAFGSSIMLYIAYLLLSQKILNEPFMYIIIAFISLVVPLATPIGFLISHKVTRSKNRKDFKGDYEVFIDERDGSKYKTIRIGNQICFAENFAFKTDNGQWSLYKNNLHDSKRYGYLYTWNIAKEICPVGWHLPTKNEWETLIKYCGEGEAFYKLVEGGATGFNALTGEIHSYDDRSDNADFWCADKDGNGKAWIFKLFDNTFLVGTKFFTDNCNIGLSVRYFKD